MSFNDLFSIPEIRAIDGPSSLIRIPSQIDVPVTDRVMALIDSPQFQRLTRISQLGLVSSVYPAANHNRFEHSLGVYRNALLFIRQLAYRPRFVAAVSIHDIEVLIVAALLHDIGHWPFCHPIEDMNLAGVPAHEDYAAAYLNQPEIADVLDKEWDVRPDEVLTLLAKDRSTPANSILSSILSGPIDVDKMDYLYRDSLHAGVPYGQNFDATRLTRSMCLNSAGDKLAITHKGRTAAELMVISRYTMFSEVYWHHAVRSATAMFQRAFFEWQQQRSSQPAFEQELDALFQADEVTMVRLLNDSAASPLCQKLLDNLFGTRRQLYKRVAHYSCLENAELYMAIAHRDYGSLVAAGNSLGTAIASEAGVPVEAGDVLVDAPPVGLEVQFEIEVDYGDGRPYRSLGEVSPLVNTLACRQFDDHVKQVRVFAKPSVATAIRDLPIDRLLSEVISRS